MSSGATIADVIGVPQVGRAVRVVTVAPLRAGEDQVAVRAVDVAAAPLLLVVRLLLVAKRRRSSRLRNRLQLMWRRQLRSRPSLSRAAEVERT